jgi:predicted nucleic acid-binding protein
MIVVSNTSPLNYLILIEAIDILPRLFGTLAIPSAVCQELQHPSNCPNSDPRRSASDPTSPKLPTLRHRTLYQTNW